MNYYLVQSERWFISIYETPPEILPGLNPALPIFLLMLPRCSFLKANLGAPTPAEFNALMEEKNAIAAELEKCKADLAEATAKIEELSKPAEEAPAEGEPAE